MKRGLIYIFIILVLVNVGFVFAGECNNSIDDDNVDLNDVKEIVRKIV